MKDEEMLNDIVKDRTFNQHYYNEGIILCKNPEVRNVFTEARDDETRDIIRLQQKIERIQNNSDAITKIFSSSNGE